MSTYTTTKIPESIISSNSEYDINSLICETETIQIENPLISDNSIADFILDLQEKLHSHNNANAENEDYILLTPDTIKGVCNFLQLHLRELFNKYNFIAPFPIVTPLYDGSIDIYWKNSNMEFLVNLIFDQISGSLLGDFYSTSQNKDEFKGIIHFKNSNINSGLLFCLSNFR